MKSPCPKDMDTVSGKYIYFFVPRISYQYLNWLCQKSGKYWKTMRLYVYMFFKINIWFKTNSQTYMIIIVKFIY